MQLFRYQAQDAKGARQRGTLEAPGARQARQTLREQGWQVLKLRPVPRSLLAGVLNRSGLSLTRRSLLTRQLATLLQAGLPLTEALQAVAEQGTRRQERQVLRGVAERVAEGHALAQALAHYPRAFPVIYRATVAAAERSGRLADVLERLAAHGEDEQALRQKVQLAMVYPVILLAVSLLVVGFLLGYVVPDVVQAFSRDQARLPLATQVLIALSDAANQCGLAALTLLLAGIALGAWALQQPPWRSRWHALALRLPGYGEFARASEAARFHQHPGDPGAQRRGLGRSDEHRCGGDRQPHPARASAAGRPRAGRGQRLGQLPDTQRHPATAHAAHDRQRRTRR